MTVTGVSPHAVRAIFTAIASARASSIPCTANDPANAAFNCSILSQAILAVKIPGRHYCLHG